MADKKSFNNEDFTKYENFYNDAKYEFKFVFGLELLKLLNEFDNLMHEWRRESQPLEKINIAKKMSNLYFHRIIPDMESLLMLGIL